MNYWIRSFVTISMALTLNHAQGMDGSLELKDAYKLVKKRFPYASHEEKLATLQLLENKDSVSRYNPDKISKIVPPYANQPWGVNLDTEETVLYLLLIESLFNIKYNQSINLTLTEVAEIIAKAKYPLDTCCNSNSLGFEAQKLLMSKAGVLEEISYQELFDKKWANLAVLEAELIRVGLSDYVTLLKQSLKEKQVLIKPKKFTLPEGAVI